MLHSLPLLEDHEAQHAQSFLTSWISADLSQLSLLRSRLSPTRTPFLEADSAQAEVSTQLTEAGDISIHLFSHVFPYVA